MNNPHHSFIHIKGARQHNLKNIDVDIPRNQFVVITGLSGSGKSSLAFDTLFAEGQRKYVESLSAYARQFLDQMQKPDVDYIEGLSPAIAIEQRTTGVNPRSTIATTTEIYDYLRLLFAAVGVPHDPVTGESITKQTPQQIVDTILSWPEGTRLMLLAPVVHREKGEFRDVIEKLQREGFVRARVDGEIIEIDTNQTIRLAKEKKHFIEAVVDRLVVREGVRQRLSDSVELALRWGESRLIVLRSRVEGGSLEIANGVEDAQIDRLGDKEQKDKLAGQVTQHWEEVPFSTNFCNPRTGFTMPMLTPKLFSFNSHLGACPRCHGLGTELFCDPELMVDEAKSLADGAIKPWRSISKRMKKYYDTLLQTLVQEFGVEENVPFRELPREFKDALFYGTKTQQAQTPAVVNETCATASTIRNSKSAIRNSFEGLVKTVERLLETSESELTKQRLRAFTSWKRCEACEGARLRPEMLAVTVSFTDRRQLNIQQVCALTIQEAGELFGQLVLDAARERVVQEILHEVRQRLGFLNRVGLGYLSLNRESGTLSGGESQRIRLATQIGSGLAGVMYVLDEPSIGLHQRDNDRLIETLRGLRDLGNSVIVVEHDEDTIRAADFILDLGPGAGPLGGELVTAGTIEDILRSERSLTGQYLCGNLRIPVPRQRRAPRAVRSIPPEPGDGWVTVVGAAENNLKNVTAAFPVGCFTCVTGVSGSGKSTLVNDILRAALARDLNRAKEKPGKHREIVGSEQLEKVVVIDQSPVGKTPRSNPATYSDAMGLIRDLFSQVPAARVRGYDAGRFSFNVKGGRCEHCKGDGMIKIEMHFLADMYVECEICRGRRYNRETLEITYKGKNIADVLEMTIDDASKFFRHIPTLSDKLDTMRQVGLGYLCLGQSATTLSGGEAQRLKLAAELSRKSTGRTLYVLDEPTTGLHFADIHKLLEVLIRLRDGGNTLIVIEHNLEVVKCADWILDLGPEGGAGGGEIVAEGPPEEIVQIGRGYTATYLKHFLGL